MAYCSFKITPFTRTVFLPLLASVQMVFHPLQLVTLSHVTICLILQFNFLQGVCMCGESAPVEFVGTVERVKHGQ